MTTYLQRNEITNNLMNDLRKFASCWDMNTNKDNITLFRTVSNRINKDITDGRKARKYFKLFSNYVGIYKGDDY